MGESKSLKRSKLKNPAVLLGALCIALLASTVGLTAYYVPFTNKLNAQIISQESNISTLNSRVVDLDNQISILNKTVNDQKSIINNQSAQISSFTSQIAALNLSYSLLQSDYSNYNASHTHADSEFNSLQNNFSSLQTNYTNLKTTFTDLKNNYNQQANYINPENITFGANNTVLNASEIQKFTSIMNRLTVYNPSPNFTGLRTLQWVSMRNSSSAPWDNYYQRSMEFLLFQIGQGADGEWQAVLSIYNAPNSTSEYVVEVSRFTWWELQVKLDGNVMVDFPQVTNDATSLESLGYATFHVTV
jgi:archaellum component FlaC